MLKPLVTGLLSLSLLVGVSQTSATGAPMESQSHLGSVAKAPSISSKQSTPKGTIFNANLVDYLSGDTGWGFNNSFEGHISADHFNVPKAHTWTITSFTAPGFYTLGHPGSVAFTVRFFERKKRGADVPGRLIREFSGNSTVVDSQWSNFTVDLSSQNFRLQSGKYWVSVTQDSTNGTNRWYQSARMPRTGKEFQVAVLNSYGTWWSEDEQNDIKGWNLRFQMSGTDESPGRMSPP